MVSPCIYMITSPSNKIYIGQTINFKRRYNAYKNFNKLYKQRALLNSFIKYGFENHRIEVIHYCKQDELNLWEEFFISMFCSYEDGLNCTTGGNAPKKKKSIPKTKEWKKKISLAHIGKKRPEFSQEWRNNLSKSLKGIPRTKEWIENLKKAANRRKQNDGYVISESQNAKRIISIKDYFQTDEGIALRKKISENTKRRFSIPVVQYSIDGQKINVFQSAREASKFIGVAHSHIINCCNGKVGSAGGYSWKKLTNEG